MTVAPKREKEKYVYAVPKIFITAWIVTFVCLLVLTGASMRYADVVDERSNKAWCELINGLDDQYQRLPPDASDNARQFAQRIHALKVRLGC